MYWTIVCPDSFLMGPYLVPSNSEVGQWTVTRLHLKENLIFLALAEEAVDAVSHATYMALMHGTMQSCSQCLRAKSNLCPVATEIPGTEYRCLSHLWKATFCKLHWCFHQLNYKSWTFTQWLDMGLCHDLNVGLEGAQNFVSLTIGLFIFNLVSLIAVAIDTHFFTKNMSLYFKCIFIVI